MQKFQIGSMQRVPLMISSILQHAAVAHGDREIVSRLVDEPLWRYDYAGLAERAGRAANMIKRLGVGPGDFVSTLAWNTHRHYELFFAVPGIGAVLHTGNPRLSDEQIAYTLNHAGSSVLLFERNFADLVQRLLPRLTNIRHFIMLADADLPDMPGVNLLGYEQLLAQEESFDQWPSFDENAGAILCYTSGTTGNPKGVLYSHRSIVLHALAAGLNSAFNFSAFDCIMPCSSLYHGTAWGVPFAAAINGCKFVLPCDKMDGASLQELIQNEGVTFSGGVPTIWTMYLDHLERTGEDAGKLTHLIIGGSAVPRAMAEKFQTKYGVAVRQLWGMTETSPLGVVATPTPKLAQLGEDAVNDVIWSRQGRLQYGIELKVVNEKGERLPADGKSAGTLMVRGPWTVERYFRSDTSALDAEGWFDTGDIATLDENGFMRITDRTKDVIKSGGEWVSSIDVENAAISCPGVRVAAVIGVYHPKWEERPLLIVETHPGETVTMEMMLAHLEDKIVKWWMPDDMILDEVPLTATGKIDKKVLRDRYYNYLADSRLQAQL
ncbi:fatty-acyl-CoA synthase [Halopseudomonas formosensis]|jgi:fatty-acyl-CoA synthase|uniref:Fatty-acyl-CoA synthase n=2 Tax=Halopseudomonas formosensis TaxID=1002526 RepID=A0A1I5ZZK8_9GAMM|nr:fatty-acyl-CoA synthase [Halopseudomonas formosensis]